MDIDRTLYIKSSKLKNVSSTISQILFFYWISTKIQPPSRFSLAHTPPLHPPCVQQILALCHRSDKQATDRTEGQGYKFNLRGGLHAAPRLHFGERRRLLRLNSIVFRSQLPGLNFPSL